jgi:hypothetical protein
VLLARALTTETTFAVLAGLVGPVWRDARKQALLARLLAADELDLELEALDDRRAQGADSAVVSPRPPMSSLRRSCSAPRRAAIRS